MNPWGNFNLMWGTMSLDSTFILLCYNTRADLVTDLKNLKIIINTLRPDQRFWIEKSEKNS